MGLGSLKPVQKITQKVNEGIGKVTNSKLVKQVFGTVSQVLRRFPTPADVANIPDPLKTAQWEVIFPTISIFIGGDKNDKLSWIPYLPICENITFTLPNLETKDLATGPAKVTMPIKRQTATTFNAEFYCDNMATILSYYNYWQELAVHEDQTVGFASDYKKSVYLYLLGFKSVTPVCLIKFKGVFPKSITSLTFKGDSKEDRIKATITFACDKIEMEPLMVGQIATTLTNNFVGNFLSHGSLSSISSLF